MEKMKSVFEQRNVEIRSVTIPKGHNAIIIHMREHTWVSVSLETEEVVSDQTSDPIVSFSMSPGNYTIKTDGKIEKVTSETREPMPSIFERLEKELPSILRLISDAPDKHIIDGIGEIPADGTSFCTITMEKLTVDGKPLSGSEHSDEIFLRTTGGTVMDDKGKKHIRSLKLKSGQAAFRLVSESSPKVVTVTAFGREPLMSKAEIQIEFV